MTPGAERNGSVNAVFSEGWEAAQAPVFAARFGPISSTVPLT
jgi:hypothetical protein